MLCKVQSNIYQTSKYVSPALCLLHKYSLLYSISARLSPFSRISASSHFEQAKKWFGDFSCCVRMTGKCLQSLVSSVAREDFGDWSNRLPQQQNTLSAEFEYTSHHRQHGSAEAAPCWRPVPCARGQAAHPLYFGHARASPEKDHREVQLAIMGKPAA